MCGRRGLVQVRWWYETKFPTFASFLQLTALHLEMVQRGEQIKANHRGQRPPRPGHPVALQPAVMRLLMR